MEMDVYFPGGKKVNATYNGFTIETDQAKNEGGDGSAPEPYSLFLASIGTCAGVYVVYFCQERGIDTSRSPAGFPTKIQSRRHQNRRAMLGEKKHPRSTPIYHFRRYQKKLMKLCKTIY